MNINPEALLNIPGNVWVYWKDIKGSYLGSNDLMAEECDFSSRSDIVGRSDYDFQNLSTESADVFIKEDQLIMSRGITRNFQERVLLRDSILQFNTIKMPLYHDNNQLAGIVGISYRISKSLEEQLSNIKKQDISHRLTKRENELLYYLVKGKTLKSAAAELGLSVRTVEYYLVNMKSKLNVATKNELIEKTINHLLG